MLRAEPARSERAASRCGIGRRTTASPVAMRRPRTRRWSKAARAEKAARAATGARGAALRQLRPAPTLPRESVEPGSRFYNLEPGSRTHARSFWIVQAFG